MKILIINNQGYTTISTRAELETIFKDPEIEFKWANTYSDWNTILVNSNDCEIFVVEEDIPLIMLKKLVKHDEKQVIMKTEEGWKQVEAVSILTKDIKK